MQTAITKQKNILTVNLKPYYITFNKRKIKCFNERNVFINKISKPIFSIFLSITLLLPFCMEASAAEIKYAEKSDISCIEKFIQEMYLCKDTEKAFSKAQYQKASASVKLENDLYDYSADKVSIQQKVSKLYETEKENYKVTVTLLNEEKFDKSIYLYTFQVISEYNYIGIEETTTVSEIVEIKYDKLNHRILDCFTPLNYYDEALRAECDFKKVKQYESTDKSALKKAQLISDIETVYTSENERKSTSLMAPGYAASSVTLNRDKIVKYARNNFKKAKPASGNGKVPYYDFSKISGSYDCTNFVSHALIAGGAKINDTGGTGIRSTGWYYRSLSNRSSSWSGVEELYSYMTTNKKANTAAGDGHIYTLNGAFWGIGDVLQLKYSLKSKYTHSTIITIKKKSADNTRSYAYVTGRTSAKQYNNNQAAADMAPNGSKRVISVYNRWN